MPSVYNGCIIQDESFEALASLTNHLQQIEEEFDEKIDELNNTLQELTTNANAASVHIGYGNWEVLWTAMQPGIEGNRLNIQYLYQCPGVDGAGNLQAKDPTGEILSDGVSILLWLGVDSSGNIADSMNTTITKWFANTPGLDELLTYSLVGSGAGIPETTDKVFFSGGTSQALKDIQNAGNDIAAVFNKRTIQELLQEIDIPVVSDAAEAAAYLEASGSYIIVNGKVLKISGTNLIGINKIYTIVKDLSTMNFILNNMVENLPIAVITQNVEKITSQVICGEIQTITEITEVYKGINVSISNAIAQWGGTAESYNYYIFWGVRTQVSTASYARIRSWGISDMYIDDIMSATNPENLEDTINKLESYVVDDLTLPNALGFTDNELLELLSKNVDGIEIPNMMTNKDKVSAFLGLLSDIPNINNNGANVATKPALTAIQTVDMEKTLNVSDIAKELAVRGKACARLAAKVPDMISIQAKGIDVPNLNFSQLPDPSKKIESAYAAVSSTIEKANSMFDRMIGKLSSTVSNFLNKITDAINLAINLDNGLAKCLLGAGTNTTGKPNFNGVSGENGIDVGSVNGIPNIESITGGIPTSIFASALKELSALLDETITSAVETIMSFIQIPLCILNTLLSSLSGFSLNGIKNICKSGNNMDEKCSPTDIQETIDASTTMSSVVNDLSYAAQLSTTEPIETIEETVNELVGSVSKTVTSTTSEITRGLNEVLSEVQDTINAKITMVDKLDKEIRDLFGDTDEQQVKLNEEIESSNSCLPPVLGSLSDSITDYL